MKITVGAVVDEPGSTVRNKTGSWRSQRPVIMKEKCKKCYTCWKFCPDNAIKVDKKTGEVSIDYDYCKGCLICVTSCPFKAIRVEGEKK